MYNNRFKNIAKGLTLHFKYVYFPTRIKIPPKRACNVHEIQQPQRKKVKLSWYIT